MRIKEWRDVVGYEGDYKVSNDGEIMRVSGSKRYNGVIHKGCSNHDGYLRVSLTKDGKEIKRFAHRLVMEAFSPLDDYTDMEVNHKDLNKANNRLENLEWVSHKRNMEHAKENGKMANRRTKETVKILNRTTGEVYQSPKEASEKLRVCLGTIQGGYEGKHKVRGFVLERMN